MENKPESKSLEVFIGRKGLGENLTRARTALGMTRDDVVEKSKTGFSRSSLQAWESGEREPKLDNLYDLANLYNIHPWLLISGNDPEPIINELRASYEVDTPEDEYVYVPAYDIKVSAGHGMFSDGAIEPKNHLAFRKEWINKKGLDPKWLAVLFNEGDSMAPTIPNHSAMVLNMLQTKAADGQVYVIRIDDRLYVKRVQLIPSGGLRLISDNKQYDSFDITKQDLQANDIEVCGQVIHLCHDLPDCS
jgi:phage repressor protein C with HTH and peptisase S24 domain